MCLHIFSISISFLLLKDPEDGAMVGGFGSDIGAPPSSASFSLGGIEKFKTSEM